MQVSYAGSFLVPFRAGSTSLAKAGVATSEATTTAALCDRNCDRDISFCGGVEGVQDCTEKRLRMKRSRLNRAAAIFEILLFSVRELEETVERLSMVKEQLVSLYTVPVAEDKEVLEDNRRFEGESAVDVIWNLSIGCPPPPTPRYLSNQSA